MQELAEAGAQHPGPEGLLCVSCRNGNDEAALRLHPERAGGLAQQLRILSVRINEPREEKRPLRLLFLCEQIRESAGRMFIEVPDELWQDLQERGLIPV